MTDARKVRACYRRVLKPLSFFAVIVAPVDATWLFFAKRRGLGVI